MPHIALPENLPGITAGFAFRPETAKPMRELAEILLRGPSTLTSGERELIATYVSSRNDCYFCQTSHGAAAAAHLGNRAHLVLWSPTRARAWCSMAAAPATASASASGPS